jgi:hypothetical protein
MKIVNTYCTSICACMSLRFENEAFDICKKHRELFLLFNVLVPNSYFSPGLLKQHAIYPERFTTRNQLLVMKIPM